MLNGIIFVLKLAAFAALVLVLGQVVHWQGKTVSDQVKTHLAHADSMGKWAGNFTGSLIEDAKKGAARKPASHTLQAVQETAEDISQTERQKLRALIRELNRSTQN